MSPQHGKSEPDPWDWSSVTFATGRFIWWISQGEKLVRDAFSVESLRGRLAPRPRVLVHAIEDHCCHTVLHPQGSIPQRVVPAPLVILTLDDITHLKTSKTYLCKINSTSHL